MGWRDSKLSFPFRSFRYLGTGLLVFSACILIVSTADLIYTGINYSKDDCGKLPNMPQQPCNHPSLIYTWVASGVWGPVLVLIPTGVLGWTFSRLKPGRLRLKRDAFGILGFLSVIVSMAIVALYSLGIAFGEDAFYRTIDDHFVVDDSVHFILPLVIVILAAVTVFMAASILFFVCCCADIPEDEDSYETRYDRYDRRDRRDRGYDRRSLDSYSDEFSVRDVPVRRIATVPPPLAPIAPYPTRPQFYNMGNPYISGAPMLGSSQQMYGGPSMYGSSYYSMPRPTVANGNRVPLPWYGRGYPGSAY